MREPPSSIEILDSTLREGLQAVGVSLSVEDRIKLALLLDEVGVHFIEGGWPGAAEADRTFLRRAKQMGLGAKIAAFTSTRRRELSADSDPILAAVLDVEPDVVVVFGKTWDLHVRVVLGATLEENLEIVRDTVEFFRRQGLAVVFDAEHFFDGYKENRDYALAVVRAAAEAGAETVVLADTNGGSLPHEVYFVTRETVEELRPLGARVGVHAHNDSGCAVANTLMAVMAGAEHAQVTVNGVGERCGNADLAAVVANLELKMGVRALRRPEGLTKLTQLSLLFYELAGLSRNPFQPYVGENAFAHKAGVHVDAVLKCPRTYEHIDPERVGNKRRLVVSQLSGRAALLALASQLGIDVSKSDPRLARALEKIKRAEVEGAGLEESQASVALTLLKEYGAYSPRFELIEWSVETGPGRARARARVRAGSRVVEAESDGVGPVHAVDLAVRRALEEVAPEVARVKLVDYRVSLLGAPKSTSSVVKVAMVLTDGERAWTSGCASTNIVEASVRALVEGLDYYLHLLSKGSAEARES
ncbi:MAG: citramalate synthase [Fervidicoccaceae archaeon]